MKIQVTIAVFLFALVGFNTVSLAQITITSADASAINAVGTVITHNFDSTTTSVNIGSPGATSWNFSALNSHTTNTFTSVLPSSTPYYLSYFPTSNVVFMFKEIIDGNSADGWQYSTQNPGNYLMDGVVEKSVIGSDIFLLKSVYSTAQVIFPLPYTFNSLWGSNFTITNTNYVNGIPFTTTTANHTETVVVDAWGNITMPGGTVLQALRLRRDDRYTSPTPPFYVRTISYSFLTKSGTAVEVVANDTTAANSGIIQTDGVTWSRPNNVSVGNEDQISTQYSLRQNYPNPFKQSTIIKYATDNTQFVSLKVYDLFGKEIKTLVNEEKTAGIYEVNFDASQITPGIYIYKLQTGLFKETKKMILLQ